MIKIYVSGDTEKVIPEFEKFGFDYFSPRGLIASLSPEGRTDKSKIVFAQGQEMVSSNILLAVGDSTETAYDVGYRGVIAGLSIDVNAYYNKYEDFIASKNAAAPLYGNVNLSDMVDLGPVTGGAAGITPISLIAVGNGDYKGVAFDSNSGSDISSYVFFFF